MTLRTKPGMTVSVTKKPDGRLVLTYTRPESIVAPPSQERSEENPAATPSGDQQNHESQSTHQGSLIESAGRQCLPSEEVDAPC
jgi:hypothetical protein